MGLRIVNQTWTPKQTTISGEWGYTITSYEVAVEFEITGDMTIEWLKTDGVEFGPGNPLTIARVKEGTLR